MVGWALAGRDRTDDALMLELLEPFKGHRHRVTRLIGLSGRGGPGGGKAGGQAGAAGFAGRARYGGGPQRRGPRMPVRDYRSF